MGVLWASIIGSLIGISGSGIGGALGALIVKPQKQHVGFAMAAAGGIMLAVTFLDILPESLKNDVPHGLAGIVCGALFVYLAGKFFSKSGNLPANEHERYINISFLMMLGIATHNLPEGMAVGSGIVSPEPASIGLIIAILLHDLPEGMAVAIPMKMTGKSNLKIILWAVLCGLPTGIGATIGYLVGSISRGFMDFCTGFAGGAMLLVVLSDILPEAMVITGFKKTLFALALGVITGIGIFMVTT